jgi:hypothetical protein
MDVYIADVVSMIRTLDDDALLTPRVKEELVRAVLAAVDEKEAHSMRMKQEMLIPSVARDELEPMLG